MCVLKEDGLAPELLQAAFVTSESKVGVRLCGDEFRRQFFVAPLHTEVLHSLPYAVKRLVAREAEADIIVPYLEIEYVAVGRHQPQ